MPRVTADFDAVAPGLAISPAGRAAEKASLRWPAAAGLVLALSGAGWAPFALMAWLLLG